MVLLLFLQLPTLKVLAPFSVPNFHGGGVWFRLPLTDERLLTIPVQIHSERKECGFFEIHGRVTANLYSQSIS